MRSQYRPEQIVRVGDIGDPVAHRLVDGVLQRPAAGVHSQHLGAEQPHADDVEGLAIHVLGAHVDVAVEPEQRARGRRRHAMLPRSGLGDNPALAHASGEQRLTDRVVDLVRARVREILALEEDPRAPRMRREALRLEHGRRAANIVRQETAQLGLEGRVIARDEIRALELFDRLDQRLGDEAPAELAEVAAGVRIAS
jgi:hypothetical protein